jgi:DNA-binding response OmpR family regulator
VRAALQELVLVLGYDVRAASNGPEALALIETELPDAILLDVTMPGMDGREVCRHLRAQPRTAALPILLVTGNVDLSDRLAGFEAGADDYVGKPFEVAELSARLRSHLALAELRSELAELRGVLATVRMISHEFNNPLQTVLGGSELLRLTPSGQPADPEALAMICEGADQLAQLSRRVVRITEPAFKSSPFGPMLDVEASR